MSDPEQMTLGQWVVQGGDKETWQEANQDTESGRDRAVRRLNEYAEERLPAKADPETWPVCHNHCFRRIAYDNACRQQWDEVYPDGSFIDVASDKHLKRALRIMVRMWHDGPEYVRRKNEISLLKRDEISPAEADYVCPEVVLSDS